MGALADCVNIRSVILIGSLTFGLTMKASSRAESLWQLYLLFFIAGALGGVALFSPLFALVGGWFRTGAGLAIGLVSAGQALGQGVIPFANAVLIERFGWRGAFLVIGLVSLAILLLLAALTLPAERPSLSGAGLSEAQDVAGIPTARFAILLSLSVIFCCCLMALPLMTFAIAAAAGLVNLGLVWTLIRMNRQPPACRTRSRVASAA